MLSIRRFLLRDILALVAVVVLGLAGLGWFGGWQILRHQAELRLGDTLDRLALDVEMVSASALRSGTTLASQAASVPQNSLNQTIHSTLSASPELLRIRLVSTTGTAIRWEATREGGLRRIDTYSTETLTPEDQKLLDHCLRQTRPFEHLGQAGHRDPQVWLTQIHPLTVDGALFGFLQVDLDSSELVGTFQRSRQGNLFMALLLAPDGLPLAGTGTLNSPQATLASELKQAIQPLLVQDTHQPQVLVLQAERHLVRVRSVASSRLMLALAIPLRELDQDYRHYRTLVVTLGIAFLGLLAWRTLVMARRFRQPLRQLAEVTRTMESGEIPQPLDTDIREVRRLSEAISKAAEAMQRQLHYERNAVASQRVELMGSLAGGIAHDVNNHLTAIMGQMGLAREGLESDHPSYIRVLRAEEAALRCSDMIRALLNFSGRTPSEMESLDLNAIVARSADLFERLLGGRITLELGLHPGLPRILGSRVNMEQVLMNLALNARDAMPEGGTLTIRTFVPEPRAVELVVSDTGRGIPPEDLPHIFEPFFSTKAPDKGSGLGLAMVQSIVQGQQGRIEVASELGSGARFSIRFPASQEAPRPSTRAVEPRMEPPSFDGKRVLVVEDETNLRELLCETFLKCRALVASAPNGEVAWRMFEESPFDLVFTDQRMPEMTGLELIHRIRGVHPALPIILASGFHLEGAELELIGRDPRLRFLAKPFSLQTALQSASALLRGTEVSGRTPQLESPASP